MKEKKSFKEWFTQLFPKCILADTVLFLLLVTIIDLILPLFGAMFRGRSVLVFGILIGIGIVAGLFQLIIKMKKGRIVFGVFFTVLVFLLFPKARLIVGLAYMPEHDVVIDGKKYVACVDAFLQTRVDYYESKGLIFCGDHKVFSEDYGKGGFDPIEHSENNYEVLSTTYYDEDGNVIETVENISD